MIPAGEPAAAGAAAGDFKAQTVMNDLGMRHQRIFQMIDFVQVRQNPSFDLRSILYPCNGGNPALASYEGRKNDGI